MVAINSGEQRKCFTKFHFREVVLDRLNIIKHLTTKWFQICQKLCALRKI